MAAAGGSSADSLSTAPFHSRAFHSSDPFPHALFHRWVKAKLDDGAWLLSRGEGYTVQNAELRPGRRPAAEALRSERGDIVS